MRKDKGTRMKTRIFLAKNEKGQALVLVVLVLFVMIAMAGLIIDGSFDMSQKRQAQAAADAAAEAGAGMLCSSQSSQAISTATSYATKNKATSASASISSNGETLTVNVTMSSTSFFSQIFGQTNLTTSATASASCYSPDQMSNVIPLTWLCTPTNNKCQNLTVDWYTDMGGGTKLPNNSSKLTMFIFNDYYSAWGDNNNGSGWNGGANCHNGYFHCSNNQPAMIFDNSSSGWVDFTGSSNNNPWTNNHYQISQQLISWNSTGYSNLVTPGAYPSASILDTYTSNIGLKANRKNSSTGLYAPYILPVSSNIVQTTGWWRKTGTITINGFSAFFITCIDWGWFNSTNCPGDSSFWNSNWSWWTFWSWLFNPYDTIEGYFVSNYPISSKSSGGLDAGLHVVSLTP